MYKVPGSYKDNSSYQEKGYKSAPNKDMAFADTRVRDEDYDYTSLTYPGGIESNNMLKADIAKHKIHKPGK